MLLHHRAAQAQPQAHALGLGGEERSEQLLGHFGGMPGPRSPRENSSPGLLAQLTRPHRTRISSRRGQRCRRCPWPAWHCASGSAAPARPWCGRTAPAAGRPAARVSTRTCSLRACRLTSGMMASSRAAGTASRAWSRRRTKSCTLRITGPPARPARQCAACARSARSVMAGGRALQQVHGPGGIAGDGGQRLVQLVAEQRRHLAYRGQPGRGLQPVLAGARQFLHPALLADVQEMRSSSRSASHAR
jgi:hypothetical protein